MADVFTKKKRSEIMSLIRARNTGIERAVFSYLRKNKIYFYPHYSKALGKPDIALPKKKIAIFIDGDFWHGYQFKRWKNRIPKMYWRDKIASNIARDVKNRRALKRKGWRIMRVWGHEISRNPDKTFLKIADFLK